MAEAAIRNAVINRLKESSQSAPRLIETLLAVYNDRQGQHAVMRDYAVQHMASWFEELTAARDPAASEVDRRKARLLETLWGAVDEIDTSIAGTALLSLDRIRRATPDFPLNRLEEAALRVAEDDGASAMAHLSALRICSRLKVRDVLPIAARLGQSGETPAIRRAALATLNDLGGPEHQRLLQRLRRQGDQDL